MNPTVTAFRALVRKDLALFIRDRRAVVVSVITPICIAGFFGFLFGGNGDNSPVTRVPVALADLDHSELTQAIVADLERDQSLEVTAMTPEEARGQVANGKLRAAIIFPPGFAAAAARVLEAGASGAGGAGNALGAGGGSAASAVLGGAAGAVAGGAAGGGGKPSVELLYDPSQALVRPIVEGLVTQHVMHQITRDALPVPFTLKNEAVSSGPHYNSYAHSFAGMSVQFILFMSIDAGVNLLLMRQQGVWRRLRAAPLSRATLLGSRVVGTTLIALMILAVVYLAAMLIFGVRIAGSVAGFAAVAVAFAILAATTGLMIASLGRSVGATRGLSIFAALILVMLGGAWVPAFVFPEWLQNVSEFVPTRWAVDGFDAMTWRGLTFHAALLPVAVTLGWSVVFAAIAVWRFDWEGE
jgi:ABC-2 type transport system permease protein